MAESREIQTRRLLCGDAYSFQGDERNIIFLSLVAAPNERIGPLTKAPDQRRFNVAMSRAEDQVWLFHSATRNDLSKQDLRYRLLEFFEDPERYENRNAAGSYEELLGIAHRAKREIDSPPKPYDSWFEVDVALDVMSRGFRVVPQYPIAGRRIDLVIEGQECQLAVECDGDTWHGPEHYDQDVDRQRMLERCGWEFWRVRASRFYAGRESAMNDLWERLGQMGIRPVREWTARPAASSTATPTPSDTGMDTQEDRQSGRAIDATRPEAEAGTDELRQVPQDAVEAPQTVESCNGEVPGDAVKTLPASADESGLQLSSDDNADTTKSLSVVSDDKSGMPRTAAQRMADNASEHIVVQIADANGGATVQRAEREAERSLFERIANGLPADVWLALSGWAKDNNVFSAAERRFLYEIGDERRRNKKVALARAVQAVQLLGRGFDAGFTIILDGKAMWALRAA